MASPYRPKFQSPRKPNTPSISRIHNPKENNNINDCSEDRRAEDRASSLKKAMKKSYASPTFAASTKSKRVRHDPSSWKPTWDKTPVNPNSPAMASSPVTEAFTVAKEQKISTRDDAMEVERTREPPTLEELQRKVKKFLEEHTPQRRPETSVNAILSEEKQSGLPPYDPKKNYLSPRPQFLRYRPDRNLDYILNGESPERFPLEIDKDQTKELGCMDKDVSKSEDVGVNGLPFEYGFTENRPRVEDFLDSEPQQGIELQSLEKQMASVDISTGIGCERKEGFGEDKQFCRYETCQVTDQDCKARQHRKDEVPVKETLTCSSIFTETDRIEEAVIRSSASMFEPKSGSVVEVEESSDDDEMEEAPKSICLVKNCLILIFAVVSALMVILASGSPGLLPSALHGNPLATSWQSSKLYSPTMKVLRGAEGLWSPPIYCDVNSQALLQHGQSGLRMRTNGFWLSAKEFCLEHFKKLGDGTEKLQGSSVSDFISMPVGFNESLDAEDSGPAMESHDENPEVPEKSFSPILPFESSQFVHSDGSEYGQDEEFGSMRYSLNEPSLVEDSVSILELHDENPSYSHDSPGESVLPIPPSGLSQCVQSDEGRHGHEVDDFHDELKDGSHGEEGHNYEPSGMSSETEGQEDADGFDGLFSPLQKHPEVPISYEIGYSWPDDIGVGTEGFDIIYGEEQTPPAENQQVMEVLVNVENAQVLESVNLDNVSDTENLPVDAEKKADGSEDNIPELVSVMDFGADISHESESHFGNSVSFDFVYSSPETETNGEIQSFEANTEAMPFESLFIQDPEELGLSFDKDGPYIPAMTSQSKALNFESQDEFEFRHNESAMSLVESSREGESDISVVYDLGASSTPTESVKYILLFGTMAASIVTVAVLATYLAGVYRKNAGCARPKKAQEHDQKLLAKKTGPTEDGHSMPRREILYPQTNHFSSMRITVPCESNFETKDSYVPRVELLNEYLPSKVVSTSERKLNTWILSSSQESSFHTPERKVRKRNNTCSETEKGSVSTQEMSMDDSPSYGSFTTLMKEGGDEEQMKITPVRRSNRLRNQKKSPLSAISTISK